MTNKDTKELLRLLEDLSYLEFEKNELKSYQVQREENDLKINSDKNLTFLRERLKDYEHRSYMIYQKLYKLTLDVYDLRSYFGDFADEVNDVLDDLINEETDDFKKR